MKRGLWLFLIITLCGLAHADYIDSGTINNTDKNAVIQIDSNLSFDTLTDNSSGIFFTSLSYTNGVPLSFSSLTFTDSGFSINSTDLPFVNTTLTTPEEVHIECPLVPAGIYTITGTYDVSKCNIDYIEAVTHTGAVTSITSGYTCNDVTNKITLTHPIYCPASGSNIVHINYRQTSPGGGSSGGGDTGDDDTDDGEDDDGEDEDEEDDDEETDEDDNDIVIPEEDEDLTGDEADGGNPIMNFSGFGTVLFGMFGLFILVIVIGGTFLLLKIME